MVPYTLYAGEGGGGRCAVGDIGSTGGSGEAGRSVIEAASWELGGAWGARGREHLHFGVTLVAGEIVQLARTKRLGRVHAVRRVIRQQLVQLAVGEGAACDSGAGTVSSSVAPKRARAI